MIPAEEFGGLRQRFSLTGELLPMGEIPIRISFNYRDRFRI